MTNKLHQESDSTNNYFKLLGILSITTTALTAIQLALEVLIFLANLKIGCIIVAPSLELFFGVALGCAVIPLIAAAALTIGVISLICSQNSNEESSAHYTRDLMRTIVALSTVTMLTEVASFMILFVGLLTNPLLLVINAIFSAATTTAFLMFTNSSPRLFSATSENTDTGEQIESSSLEVASYVVS